MPRSGSVVVVGDLLVDIVVVPTGPLVRGSDTDASVRTLGGGAAANTACWLASVGRDVSLVATVGDDPLGRGAVAEVVGAGVRWAGATTGERPTGSCVVLVDEHDGGERTMLPDRGANDTLDPDLVTAAIADGAAWVHLSGYALLGDGSRAAGIAAVEAAQARGIPLSVDAASAAPLRAVGSETFLGWIEGCTVLFANDDEVAALGGDAAILEHCDQLVAKHGARGSSWTDGDAVARTGAVAVVVVDTVGAGDAFDAGYVDAVLAGAAPGPALDAGAALAARAVAQQGARPRGAPIR